MKHITMVLVSEQDVLKAMRMVENPREWLNCEADHKTMANLLEDYAHRGLYAGDVETAMALLKLEGFEVSQ